MIERKNRLELCWIGKKEIPRLEPRILIEDREYSILHGGDAGRDEKGENMLIHGDNLLVLKALEKKFAGSVKCVFIDPPYNTGSAFDQYDDGIEHSLWLSLMRDRLQIIHTLISDEGSLWISIDDNECHYLKIMLDEIFGRSNFVASCAWEKDKGGRGDADISLSHDHILVYSKNRRVWSSVRNLLPRTTTQLGRFKNPDNDIRGPWRQGDDGTAKSGTEKQKFKVVLPSGRTVQPPSGRYWAFAEETLKAARREGRAYFGKDGDRLPIIKRYLSEVRDGVAPRTWWPADEVGTNQSAKRDHLNKLLEGVTPFATPKPEALLKRIIEISTNPGDLVLDSFAGSGTTGAVAHKLGRRWIMVELGEHCITHIVPRMNKVIAGEDHGGISEARELVWESKLSPKRLRKMEAILEELDAAENEVSHIYKKFERKIHGALLQSYGLLEPTKSSIGGGYKFFRLAPSLLQTDKWNNWVVNKKFNAEMLAEAVCKLEGFKYAPSKETFWCHGNSTESDFIYVTTQNLSYDQLQFISNQVGNDRTLLICCGAFRAKRNDFDNLTLKKIPQAVLSRCEWGRDDYSLNVDAQAPVTAVEEQVAETKAGKKKKATKAAGKKAGGKKKAATKRSG